MCASAGNSLVQQLAEARTKNMRLGILGGTFDPVHYGHLLLAESAREQCRLDQVWFLPAAIPPHKQGHVLSDVEQRIEMLELAVAGNPAMIVSRLEADRGGVTYTVETLEALRAEDPQRELLFLMGADSLADLPNWREPARICELTIPVVVRRAGQAVDYSRLAELVPAQRLELFRQHQVEMPAIELSSHDIRDRVGRGQSILYRTPRAVEKYIETHGLYRPAAR
jgi:nicotinate-nucleotide adenylyltransferase